jgi:eukaryotic-like serine/threonine-protein kinase
VTILLWAMLLQDWPTYHGGYSLDGATPQAPPDAPVLLWRAKVGARIHATPLVADGRIYAATSKGGLVALGFDGKELWSVQLGKDPVNASPLYLERTILLGSGSGTLYAVDAATGKEKWTYAVGDSIHGSANRVSLPGGKTGVIVVSQSDGSIHCVDLATGKLEWKTPEVERCDGSPSVHDGRIVLGSCASALHIFSAAKAGKSVDIDLGGDSQVAGGVAMVGTLAFAGTRSGKVVAADVAAAKLLWTNADGKKEAFGTPAVDALRVITGSDDGKIRALDRATGATLWTYDAKDTPTSAVLAGARVVAGAGGALVLLDAATGAKVWSAEVGDELSPPAVVGGVIYVGADDGTVSAWGKK